MFTNRIAIGWCEVQQEVLVLANAIKLVVDTPCENAGRRTFSRCLPRWCKSNILSIGFESMTAGWKRPPARVPRRRLLQRASGGAPVMDSAEASCGISISPRPVVYVILPLRGRGGEAIASWRLSRRPRGPAGNLRGYPREHPADHLLSLTIVLVIWMAARVHPPATGPAGPGDAGLWPRRAGSTHLLPTAGRDQQLATAFNRMAEELQRTHRNSSNRGRPDGAGAAASTGAEAGGGRPAGERGGARGRTPINIISGHAESIRKGLPPTTRRNGMSPPFFGRPSESRKVSASSWTTRDLGGPRSALIP